jgi:hypothetical protein
VETRENIRKHPLPKEFHSTEMRCDGFPTSQQKPKTTTVKVVVFLCFKKEEKVVIVLYRELFKILVIIPKTQEFNSVIFKTIVQCDLF